MELGLKTSGADRWRPWTIDQKTCETSTKKFTINGSNTVRLVRNNDFTGSQEAV